MDASRPDRRLDRSARVRAARRRVGRRRILTAAHEAGLREVRLIHGRGKGVQRGIVQQTLESHPLVVEFWDAPETHLGATVARLR